MVLRLIVVAGFVACCLSASVASAQDLFPDKNLEAAVRKEVFVVEGGLMPPFLSQEPFWVFVIAVCFILFLLFGFNWVH